MSFNKRFFPVGGIVASSQAAVCNTESVQAFGVENAFSSNVALYQLDGDGGVTNNVPDTTTNYNGTATNVTYSTGQFGQAAVFDGSSSINAGTDVLTSLTAYTVSGWVNPTGSGNRTIVANYGFNGSVESGWIFAIGVGNVVRVWNAKSGTSYIKDSTGTVVNNQWSHVAVTTTQSELKIYINGSLDTTHSITGFDHSGSITDYLSIGVYQFQVAGYYGSYYTGKIDQVRIFNRAITPEEVSTLYNETDVSNTNPLSDGSGVALYTLDYDASDAGGLYDGTPTDVDFGVDGQINYGARFNGSSSKIDVGNQTWFDSDFTLSMWFYPQNASGTSFQVLAYKRDNSDYTMPFGLGLYEPNHGTYPQKLSFGLGSSGNNAIYVYTTNTYNVNSWNHVAVKISGTAMSMTLNGIESTATFTGTRQTNTSTIRFGNKYTVDGDYPYDGSIDQVRIFSKSLSSSEVSTLYAETACVHTCTTDTVNYPSGTTPVAYYKLDNSAEDETGNYDGTESNIEYRFGRYGQAAVFNGTTSSYIRYASLESFFHQKQTLTLSLWFYTSLNSSTAGTLFTDYAVQSFNSGCYIQNGNIVINTRYNSVDRSYTSSATYLNAWTHLAVTLDQNTGERKVYINGSLEDTQTVSTNNWTSNHSDNRVQSGTLFSDYNNTQNNPYNGSIDQVRIFSTALDSDQVSQLYNEKPCEDTSNFKTVLYTGNGGSQYISNVGFEPDLVWIKSRNSIYSGNHQWFDSVRGAGKVIYSDGTYLEATNPIDGYLGSFDSNGFSLSSGTRNTNDVSNSGENYVAWVWKGGGDAVSNTDGVTSGSVTAVTSTVSANQDAGFSINKFTTPSSGLTSWGHGLSESPELIILKATGLTQNWIVYAPSILGQKDGNLNTTDAFTSYSPDIISVDSSKIDLGRSGYGLSGSSDYIAYCFHSVSGYSKIGSYEGNGSTDGPTVNIGFEPSWLMIKKTSGTSQWLLVDNARSPSNPVNARLRADKINAESTSYDILNFLSNGFKIITADNDQNTNNEDYLYMAFK